MSMGISSAFAAALPTGTKDADKTITITPPSGLAADASNTYTVYKVFAATTDGSAISYKSLDGTAPDGFVVDDANNVYLGTATDAATGAAGEFAIKVGGATKYIVPVTAGELTAEQIAAIAAYGGKVEVGTVTITGTTATTVTVPDYGYYYITTSTGSVVTIDSTHKSADVQDKNSVPGLNKQITKTDNAEAGMAGAIDAEGKKALAELGKEVEYTATITVGKGAIGYEFHDKMGTGLTFKGNDYVTVTADPAVTGITGDWYTIKATPDSGDTLTITFADGIAENTIITVKYIGTVNSDALTIDTGKNTARVDYGDENSNNHTPDSETNVYNGKVNVTKTDGKGDALEGAGFKLKNADNKWYKVEGTVVSWVANEADGTEIFPVKGSTTAPNPDYDPEDPESSETITTEGTDAVASFTGLVNGTYTLVETTVPAGYNKAADSKVTIADSDFNANISASTTVVNNSGAELPSTGGIGTTIFYVVGSILVVAAGVLLITKKRMSREG